MDITLCMRQSLYFHRYISKSINCLVFIVRGDSSIYIYIYLKINFNTDNYLKLDTRVIVGECV